MIIDIFPDPDLPPLIITKQKIDDLKKILPELPDEMKKRFLQDYNLKNYDAEIIVNDQDVAIFFEELVKKKEIQN